MMAWGYAVSAVYFGAAGGRKNVLAEYAPLEGLRSCIGSSSLQVPVAGYRGDGGLGFHYGRCLTWCRWQQEKAFWKSNTSWKGYYLGSEVAHRKRLSQALGAMVAQGTAVAATPLCCTDSGVKRYGEAITKEGIGYWV